MLYYSKGRLYEEITTNGNRVDIIGVLPKCFTEFSEFNDKNICDYSKRARTCDIATSCVRDQDATTVPTRNM